MPSMPEGSPFDHSKKFSLDIQMQAALDLIAQVTYPDDPPTLSNETIDKVQNMAQTVNEMITNAFHTISKANSEVDVKNDNRRIEAV